jgi:spore germination protein YaaH
MAFPLQVRPHRHARRVVAPGLALLLVLATLPAAGLAGDARLPAAGLTGAGPIALATAIRPRVTGIQPMSHEVYGYLPYWRLDAGTAGRIHYELVSTIAFFGLGIKATGDLDTAWVGYKEYVGDDAVAVTNAAHDRGVRVVPTFQLFDMGTGAPKMSAFLGSTAAQDRFIAQALDLMAARQADGAGLDFEPVGALAARAPQFVAFVARFRQAMKARFPSATLVNATSAGATQALVEGIVPYVDRQMIMTYNYHSKGSAVTGPIAPLDNATRTVKMHIAKMLAWAPAKSILMGVPYYGYDWPVTRNVPYATVRSDKTKYGKVTSVTYASARDFLAAHPTVARHYDAAQGSGWYSYWSTTYGTYRQVYFEEERSLAAKYDYAILTGLAGVGIWTLGNDAGYEKLWNVLRSKFYAPVHAVTLRGSVSLTKRSGSVIAVVRGSATNAGTVPERGRWWWAIRTPGGTIVKSGSWAANTIYPGRAIAHAERVTLGRATSLRAGTYTLRVLFITSPKIWRSPVIGFRQPY